MDITELVQAGSMRSLICIGRHASVLSDAMSSPTVRFIIVVLLSFVELPVTKGTELVGTAINQLSPCKAVLNTTGEVVDLESLQRIDGSPR